MDEDEFLEPIDFANGGADYNSLAGRRQALEYERDSLAVENLALDIKDERRKLDSRRWSEFWQSWNPFS